jgi:DNA transformation protein
VALENPEGLRDLFSEFGPISVRRMFSGFGLFADGLMFGLVLRGDIFLKTDEQTIPSFKAENSHPFVYKSKGRDVTLSYWRLPDRLLDDPDELTLFARAALGAAHRSAAKKIPGAITKNWKSKKKAVKRSATRQPSR